MSNTPKIGRTKQLEERNQALEEQGIRLTKFGAFKSKARREAERPQTSVSPKIDLSGAAAKALRPQLFKLQRSIMTTEAQPMVLAYNKDRSWQGEFPLTEDLEKVFNGRLKIFVLATPDKSGLLHLSEGVHEDPGW